MLTLRLQRTGRKKLAQYRLIAQEKRLSPTSGRVAAYLGSYNPHTKENTFDFEAIQKYLDNGAQPSNKVAKLLKGQKAITLPEWVSIHQFPEKKVESEETTDDGAEAKESDTKAEKDSEATSKDEKDSDEKDSDEKDSDEKDSDEKDS